MEKKNRRFEIQSKVRVPDMEDIYKAASNFNEVSDEQNRDFVARNAKHFITTNDSDKFEKHLGDMKKEMEQLAMAVASEDKAKTESSVRNSTDTSKLIETDTKQAAEQVPEIMTVDGLVVKNSDGEAAKV